MYVTRWLIIEGPSHIPALYDMIVQTVYLSK